MAEPTNSEAAKDAKYNAQMLLELAGLIADDVDRGDYDSAGVGLMDVGVCMGRLNEALEKLMD